MTKIETLAEATELCKTHKASPALTEALTALLAPKKGGGTFNIDDSAVMLNGKAIFILDSVLKVWVPVLDHTGADIFYPKPDTELGYSRFCRAAEKARKDSEKTFKASKDGIFKDLMAGEIDQTAAQSLMEKAETARKTLVATGPFVGYTERPEASYIKTAHAELKSLTDKAAAQATADAKAAEEALAAEAEEEEVA